MRSDTNGKAYLYERERVEIFSRLAAKQIRVSKASKFLGLSSRQVKRLKKRFVANGPEDLISKKVEASGNRQIPTEQKNLVLDFLKCEDHHDFGPTLAHEYLTEGATLKISVSSVRNIMIQHGLWHSNKVRKLIVHPLRLRRPRKGELIQLDGSIHDWFEERGPKCTLLVYIDNATSETVSGK